MTDQIISKEGYEKLKHELELLSNTRRKEIAERIQKAKDMGDLSENAEYSEAKDAQAFNEGRIIEVQSLLKNLTIVANGGGKEAIGMGSVITVRIDDKERVYTIVSFNEVDPAQGKISNECLVGAALLGAKVGDTISVEAPMGKQSFKVISILDPSVSDSQCFRNGCVIKIQQGRCVFALLFFNTIGHCDQGHCLGNRIF